MQDLWKPVSRLSLSLGLRADKVLIDDLYLQQEHHERVARRAPAGRPYMATGDGRNACARPGPKCTTCHRDADSGDRQHARTQTDYYDNNLDGVFENSVTIPASTALNMSRQVDPKYTWATSRR